MNTDSPVATRFIASPNHNERIQPVDMLILHYTGMTDSEAALQRLCDPETEVSAHYLVYENGHCIQLVPEARRAWHAGLGRWKGQEDINSRSIGIEIANAGHPACPLYPEVQIATLIELARDIQARWHIASARVLAHSDTAPQRKQDPGEHFPWDRLHDAGIGHYVRPVPVRGGGFFQRGDHGEPVEALQAMFAVYGYDMPITGIFDAETEAVISAFQRHFRPERVDGIADASTITTLRDLIESQPPVYA